MNESKSRVVYALRLRIVVVTRNPDLPLTADVSAYLETIAAGVAKQRGGVLERFDWAAGHIDMTISVPPTETPAQWANSFKTASARKVRRRVPAYKDEPLWRRAYFVASEAGATEADVAAFTARARRGRGRPRLEDSVA